MTRSATLTVRWTTVAICLLIAAGLISPAVASANSIQPVSGDDVALTDEVCIADGDRIDRSKQVKDEHVRPGPAEQAQNFEDGAEKHIKDGNHRSAALAYEQAALHWKKACKLDEAVAALRKAGEQWKKAGDKEAAKKAFEEALALERSFR